LKGGADLERLLELIQALSLLGRAEVPDSLLKGIGGGQEGHVVEQCPPPCSLHSPHGWK
jgi:hypothetical protein